MTPLNSRKAPRFSLIWFVVTLATTTGCASLQFPDEMPALPFSSPGSDQYQGIDTSFELQASDPEQTYHSVRQARSQNSIVLQVAGDKTPVRVLPLPPGQRSVFVSDLLKQTGVQKKLHSIEAILYRHSTDTIGGIPMAVKMSPDGSSVRPESDYALQAGDRLKVRKAASPAVKGLLSAVLGI